MFTDWKTTVTALVTAIATIAAHFNLVIPDAWQAIIIALGVALLGILAKDKK